MSHIQLTTALDDLNKQCFSQFDKIKQNNLKFKQRVKQNKLECIKTMNRIKSESSLHKIKHSFEKIDFNNPYQTMEYINQQVSEIMSNNITKRISQDRKNQMTFKLDINKTVMPDITNQIKLNSLDNSEIKLSKTPVTQATKYYVAKSFPNMYNTVCKSNNPIQSTDPDYDVLDLKQFLDEYDESVYTKEITEKRNSELLYNSKHDAVKHKRFEKLLVETPKLNRFAYTSMYCPINDKIEIKKKVSPGFLLLNGVENPMIVPITKSVDFKLPVDIEIENENKVTKVPGKFDRRGSVMLKNKGIVINGPPPEESIETIEHVRKQTPGEFYYILKDKTEKSTSNEKNKKELIGQPFGYDQYRYNHVDNLDKIMHNLEKQSFLRGSSRSKSKFNSESFLPLGRSEQLIDSILMNASDDAKKYSIMADNSQEEETQAVLNPIMQMAKLNRLASMTYSDRKSTISLINDPPKTPKNFPK